MNMRSPASDARGTLRAALDHARHLVPAQSPLDRFVHHNPLHAFEALPFEAGVEAAALALGNQPWLPEASYRAAWDRGRVVETDLCAALHAHTPDGEALPGLSRRVLHRALLLHGIEALDREPLAWRLTETDALTAPRADLDPATRAGVLGGSADSAWAVGRLWDACRELAPRLASAPAPEATRVRDLVLARTGLDLDARVHMTLVRWTAAWLDHGVAYWSMAERSVGFLAAVRAHTVEASALRPWTAGLRARLTCAPSAEEVAIAMLRELGHPEESWEEVVTATLLALRGFAGMVQRLADAPDHAPEPSLALPAELLDFLAVRLALEASAAAWALPGAGTLRERALALPEPEPEPASDRSWTLFQLAQLLGWDAATVRSRGPAQMEALLHELDGFPALLRRRVWHAAWERHHRVEVLDAVLAHRPVGAPAPRLQAVFCIDDREESLRRHLEEIAPWIETLGVAGNFGIAMQVRGPSRGHPVTLAAAGVVARHLVEEGAPAKAAWRDHLDVGSRTLARGVLASFGGFLAAVPLALGAFDPERLLPGVPLGEPVVRHVPGTPPVNGLQVGFTVDEMTNLVRGTLSVMGLSVFSPLVLICGHASTTSNNPHHAAYQCGACGGAPGGTNARVFARMANDPEVRARLATGGLEIPADTWFLAGVHDTCTDAVTLYDEALVPAGHHRLVDELRAALAEAGALDAQERCRKFEPTPLGVSPAVALRHVRRRAADLAQPRPEYGHGTNAVCVVGRRARTRGLFLDRRAFLVSYDPEADADGRVLARLLGVVVPVGAGINLEYWFGSVDPERYGCGTKLAHNLTGLVGVMDGHASDLRTGLPWQTLELHEPVRLLCVVEATPEAILRVAANNADVGRLVGNGWVKVAALDPRDQRLHVFEDGAFRPWVPERRTLPEVSRSVDWFGGTRELLGPARISGEVSDVR